LCLRPLLCFHRRRQQKKMLNAYKCSH
jgi:hypothetical protein